MAAFAAGADGVGEGVHAVALAGGERANVHAVHQKGLGAGVAERRVQHGATFGGVDFVAAKHGLEPFGGAGFYKKLLQKAQGFFGDAVLGVVEEEEVVQADGLRRNAGRIREEVAQMQVEGGGMGLKGLPGAGFRRIHGILKK